MIMTSLFFRRVQCCAALLVIASTGMSRLNAQATGSIVGTVTDTSGAAVAVANIQVKNVATGVAQTTKTDDQGRYRVPELIIGEYEIQASKEGFSTSLHSGVTLTVGAQPVVDFRLAALPAACRPTQDTQGQVFLAVQLLDGCIQVIFQFTRVLDKWN